MGRWAMYRRRGGSVTPSGLLILSVVNTGDDVNFLVTLSGPPDFGVGTVPTDMTIGGDPVFDLLPDAGNVVNAQMANPVAASGAWSVSGVLFPESPLLYPQSGSY